MSSSLHTHSAYSLLDGFSMPEENMKRASELGLKALAITEHGEVTSWPYYSELQDKYPDVKLLYGIEAYECPDREVKDPDNKYWHLILIARNELGRQAINRLSTLGHLHGFYSKPRISLLDIAKEDTDNLIVTSACLASHLSREKDYEKCVALVNEYKTVCKHFYLEIQAHDNTIQAEYNQKIMHLAKDTNTKVVVTNDVHAATKEDLKYQDVFVRIANDRETAAEIYDGCYFMSDAEIHAILDKQIGSDAASRCLQTTDEVADLCDVISMPWHEPELPKIQIPQQYASSAAYLRALVKKGFVRRGCDKFDAEKQRIYKQRIKEELDVIEKKDFCDYFLILVDYISWCRQNGIIVGPGRGSACGSLVCYLIGITELDSIKYDLDFGRFLTIERKDLPDVDVDVSDRAPVVEYLTNKYGEDRVVQVMNIVFTTPVTSIRDAGRILGFPYAEMQKISKGFIQKTWQDCLEANPDVAENPRYAELLDYAGRITGRPRGYGIHAGGVIVCRQPYYEYIGIRHGQEGEHVISVDKIMDERIGLVKFDILGVASLVAINEAMEEDHIPAWEININNPAFEHDKASYDLICSGKTDSVFQIESSGMKDLVAQLQPRSMEELSALIALYRPDAMPSIPTYVENKKHPEKITYFHPDAKPIFEKTYGVNIYQEQSMKITKVFGGRSDAGADRMRKCLAKKKPEKVKEEVELLHSEILTHGYDEKTANTICDELSTKGGYGFNKCVSGDTKMMRQKGKQFEPTIEEMYLIKHDAEYAKKTNHWNLHKKYCSKNGYGSAFSMCDDGRIRKNKIVDIMYSGFRTVYEVKTETGALIKCTDNHKFPTVNGIKYLRDMKPGDMIYEIGAYEQCTNKYNLTDGNFDDNYPVMGQRGFQFKDYSPVRNFEQIRDYHLRHRDACKICGVQYDGALRFELHHKDFNRENNDPSNFTWCCTSCHKKLHYEHGRIKQYQKGIPTKTVKIVSITNVGQEDVYDVTMDAPNHNFVVSTGIVTCNSHSQAYSVILLQTAYLKAHHPVAFFKAMMNLNKDKVGKVNKIMVDARQFGVQILPPNINHSGKNFTVVNGKILFGLSAIGGIGKTLADDIMQDREANGLYKNFSDFVARVHPTKAQIVALVKSGAIPCKNKRQFMIRYFMNGIQCSEFKPVSTLPTRARLLSEYNIDVTKYMDGKKVDKEAVLKIYNQARRVKSEAEKLEKQNKLLAEYSEKYLKDEPFWEFQTLQTFISDKNPFEEAFKYLRDFSEVEEGGDCVLVGVISNVQKKKTKTGQQFAFVNLYSGSGIIELTVWPTTLSHNQDLIVKGSQVAVIGRKEDESHVVVNKVKSYKQWLHDRELNL